MIITFKDEDGNEFSVDFVKVPTKDEGVAAFVETFGTPWADSACAQRAQTSLRTTANGWISNGASVEECQHMARTHTLGRGGPRKSNVEKELTRVEKMSDEDEEALRQRLNERAEAAREAAD